jgi:hypothetical protein
LEGAVEVIMFLANDTLEKIIDHKSAEDNSRDNSKLAACAHACKCVIPFTSRGDSPRWPPTLYASRSCAKSQGLMVLSSRELR